MPGNEKILNEALRLVRIYHDKNQTEMANALGISKSYLSEIEKGDKNVSISLLEKYSQALNIPMSSLLFFAEELDGTEHPSRSQIAVAKGVLKFLKLLSADRKLDEQEEERNLST